MPTLAMHGTMTVVDHRTVDAKNVEVGARSGVTTVGSMTGVMNPLLPSGAATVTTAIGASGLATIETTGIGVRAATEIGTGSPGTTATDGARGARPAMTAKIAVGTASGVRLRALRLRTTDLGGTSVKRRALSVPTLGLRATSLQSLNPLLRTRWMPTRSRR